LFGTYFSGKTVRNCPEVRQLGGCVGGDQTEKEDKKNGEPARMLYALVLPNG
jgi:hypothetical protein